jgi:hypothetical protein
MGRQVQTATTSSEWEHASEAALRVRLHKGHLRRLCPDLAKHGLAQKMKSATGQTAWYVRADWQGPWATQPPPAPPSDPVVVRIEVHASGRIVIDPIRK